MQDARDRLQVAEANVQRLTLQLEVTHDTPMIASVGSVDKSEVERLLKEKGELQRQLGKLDGVSKELDKARRDLAYYQSIPALTKQEGKHVSTQESNQESNQKQESRRELEALQRLLSQERARREKAEAETMRLLERLAMDEHRPARLKRDSIFSATVDPESLSRHGRITSMSSLTLASVVRTAFVNGSKTKKLVAGYILALHIALVYLVLKAVFN